VALDVTLVIVGALGIAVVFTSALIRHLPLSEPLIALALGVALGPEVLDVTDFGRGTDVLHVATEVGLAIALMAVALRFPWPEVRQHLRPVLFMITIGMVAMAAIVGALAWWLLPVGLSAAVLVGGALAPTDPVLSSSVVTGKPAADILPHRLRLMLSVESGFNDGLALPLVIAGVVLVRDDGLGRFTIEGLLSLAIAVVGGWALGAAAGAVFRRLEDHRDVEDSAFFVFTLVLPLFVLGVINLLGGDGVLAVFIGGLAYNRQVGASIYEAEREVEEGINRLLLLPLFLLFGAVLPWAEWEALGWERLVAFAIGVLLVRRIPVVLTLKRQLGLGWAGTAVYGWFGPMGVASLFYATLALEEHAAGEIVWPAVAMVVAASTVVHGASSAPVRALYGQIADRTG
jgi:NhaP-type Na+/H+ or K+/H+ antiporter